MAENFENTVNSLIKGMEDLITTKTVVGEAIYAGDTIIVPLCDVSFGMIASSKAEQRRHNGGGGMGGKMQPNSVLIIKDGVTRLVSVKDQDTVSKMVGMVPEFISYFRADKAKNSDPDVKEAVDEAAEKKETF